MNHDVIIVGAGPAGLSFARMLADSGLDIAVLEKQPEKVIASPDYDGREIALTHLSQRIMDKTGMWGRIPEKGISLIKDAKVLNGSLDNPLFFDHRKSGKDNLGYMISNHLIRKAAYEVVKSKKSIHLINDVEVAGVRTDENGGQVTLKDGTGLSARLIVAADSRFSPTRSMMGIPVSSHDFGRTCIVCRVKLDRDHDDTAYECFFYDWTLAVLPLKGRYCSVVITIATEQKNLILKQTPAEFGRELTQRMEGKFGNMTLDTQLYPYPLVGVYADRFYAPSYALIGDAAVGMHPVTAHGFNFGLRGGANLAEKITGALELGLDFATRDLLQAFDREHRNVTRPLYLATNALVALYTNTSPLAKIARKSLLAVGQHLPIAKRIIMNQLTEAHEGKAA